MPAHAGHPMKQIFFTVLVDKKLNMSQQCASCDNMNQYYLWLHWKEHSWQVEGGDPSLILSLVRHIWNAASCFGHPSTRQMDTYWRKFKKVTKVIKGLDHLAYKEILRELQFFSLEMIRVRGI